jgi:hypothetical protein
MTVSIINAFCGKEGGCADMSRFELATISFDDKNIWCNDCVKLHLLSMIERLRFVLNSYCILIDYFYRMVRTSVLFPHVEFFGCTLRVQCNNVTMTVESW